MVDLLLYFVFDILFSWTGGVVLYLVTLGRHHPPWHFQDGDAPEGPHDIFGANWFIGLVSWIVILGWIAYFW